MRSGVALHDLHAAAVTMHVAEAADVHQDVEAELLSGAEGARNLVVAAAMAQAQVDDFAALRFGQSLHHLANLAVGMVGVLVEQGGCQLDLQRVVVEQINHGRGLDGDSAQQLRGSSGQFAASLDLVGTGLGVLHQGRRYANVAQQKLAGALA